MPCVQIRYDNKLLIAKVSPAFSVAMHGGECVCVRANTVLACMNKHDV